MTYLVTGAAGFIGSNFVRYILNNTISEVYGLDTLTYAGHFGNLLDLVDNPKFKFIRGNICDVDDVEEGMSHADVVVNFAAESHVDRSISSAQPFVTTNVVGTQILLDSALRHHVDLFVQISTDEVYGALGKTGYFTETTTLNPTSPYSASKASADLLALSYYKTHNLPVIITRCCNNYGPNQFPEKVIPLFVTNLLQNKKVPLYGDGSNIRDWIFVEDHCSAILKVVEDGVIGDVYNVGANCELSNLELTKRILSACNKDDRSIEHVKDRLGHDWRYAVDATKLKSLGWQPSMDFNQGLSKTLQWYKDNTEWWEGVLTGSYKDIYDDWYLCEI